MKAIASRNGLDATRRAFEILQQGGDTLDACVEGVALVEDDPADDTVGYGGLPNEEGVVELDAAVMHGPTHRGAGVAALQGIRHPAQVARLVMQQTNRVLLVGEGALKFALANGFQPENLLTEEARKKWLHWKRTRSTVDDWVAPDVDQPPDERDFQRPTGTVHVAALDSSRNVSCCTSTSGHAFKIPGRVGDSPILGAGLYADNEVGTCGSVGWGEANLENLSSFAAIEMMRFGMSPQEAGLHVLKRIVQHCPRRLLDESGRPKFNVRLFLLARDGSHAGVTLWGEHQMAVTDQAGSRLEDCKALLG